MKYEINIFWDKVINIHKSYFLYNDWQLRLSNNTFFEKFNLLDSKDINDFKYSTLKSVPFSWDTKLMVHTYFLPIFNFRTFYFLLLFFAKNLVLDSSKNLHALTDECSDCGQILSNILGIKTLKTRYRCTCHALGKYITEHTYTYRTLHKQTKKFAFFQWHFSIRFCTKLNNLLHGSFLFF